MRTCFRLISLILLSASLAACSSEPLRVTDIQVGRSLNADQTVATHTTKFRPGDTVYVSVKTAGSGAGTIGVRWLYGARVIGEPKKQVEYRNEAATEFNLKSGSGFPPGEYTVEVFLDGESAGTRTFRVEAD